MALRSSIVKRGPTAEKIKHMRCAYTAKCRATIHDQNIFCVNFTASVNKEAASGDLAAAGTLVQWRVLTENIMNMNSKRLS